MPVFGAGSPPTTTFNQLCLSEALSWVTNKALITNALYTKSVVDVGAQNFMMLPEVKSWDRKYCSLRGDIKYGKLTN